MEDELVQYEVLLERQAGEWEPLYPIERWYFYVQAYVVKTWKWILAGITAVLAILAVLGWLLSQNPLFGIALLIAGIMIGVIITWIYEAKG